MNFEIYEENKPTKEEPVRLRLTKDPDGSISVRAVDTRGVFKEDGHLLRFTTNGVLHRVGVIGVCLGFQLDEQKRIKLGAV